MEKFYFGAMRSNHTPEELAIHCRHHGQTHGMSPCPASGFSCPLNMQCHCKDVNTEHWSNFTIPQPKPKRLYNVSIEFKKVGYNLWAMNEDEANDRAVERFIAEYGREAGDLIQAYEIKMVKENEVDDRNAD